MSALRVAIPITRLKLRLKLYKGHSWSVIEHLVLDALVRKPRALGALVQGFDIPKPVIEEALMRLLRAQWARITTADAGSVAFEATPFGQRAATYEDLPSAARLAERERWLVFERVAGHVFRPGDLDAVTQRELRGLPHADQIAHLLPVLEEGQYRPEEVADVALEEDEQLVGVEPTGEFSANRFALVEVSDRVISGLPADRDLAVLRSAIAEIADRPRQGAVHVVTCSPRRTVDTRQSHPIQLSEDDWIVGGSDHKELLLQILDTAVSRVIIHSTFLSAGRFSQFLGSMEKAVERGVQIDILWGQEARQNEDGDPQPPPAETAAWDLLENPRVLALRDRLRIHLQSTRSHAKIIVSDPYRIGAWQAVVGSCNWLDTPFRKVELSVRVSGAGIIRDILRELMGLVHAGGPWTPLVTEMYQMAEILRPDAAAATANGTARLVVNAGHNDELLRARDAVERQLLLVSHRLGAHYDCGALLPLAAACRSGKIDARILYSRRDRTQRLRQSQLEREAKSQGIQLDLIEEPQLHAKVLAWDDDSVVVTSQNWLSRDPSPSIVVRELGLAIESPGAAGHVMRLLASCIDASAPSRTLRPQP